MILRGTVTRPILKAVSLPIKPERIDWGGWWGVVEGDKEIFAGEGSGTDGDSQEARVLLFVVI
jgi:hypothetical protein